MPRTARPKNESGIYPVMLRSIIQQQIFEEREECGDFLSALNDCKVLSGFKLYVYCMRRNYIHLLIKEEIESLHQIFRRIGSRYVYWYNAKYNRAGHLLQGR